MKKIKLKKFVIPDRQEPMTSKELLERALVADEGGLQGLDNVYKAIRIYDKIQKAQDELVLEDAEFEFLYRALNTCKWGPAIFFLREFFDELNNVRMQEE